MSPGIISTDLAVEPPRVDVAHKIINGVTANGHPTVAVQRKTTPVLSRDVASLFSLAGTTTLITGAGRGLGITLAAAVLEADGDVACIDILNEPTATEWAVLQQKANARGCSISYHKCDITDEEAMKQIFDHVSLGAQTRSAPLSGVVACAGIQQQLPALEYPGADFERIMRVNVTGTFLTAKYAARKMVANGTRGSIVLVASMSGQVANRVRTCPCTSSETSLMMNTGTLMLGVQLKQSRCAADGPLACAGMGPMGYTDQHVVSRLY